MGSFQKNDRQDYYDISKKFLLLSGQWPNQKPRDRLLRMSVILTWTITILAAQIARFYAVCETTQCILEIIPMHMTAWISMLKLLTCYFNNRRIEQLIEYLSHDWDILDTEEEWEIMRRYAMNGRWYTLLYASYVYICAFTFGSSALLPRVMDAIIPLNESRAIILPAPAYYFVDEAEYFYYIFLHLQCGAMVCLIGLIAHDCSFLIYVEHACGLFAILGFRFEHHLYKRNITNKCLIDSSDVYGKNIAFSIQAHHKVLQFATLLEKTFSASFVIQILIVVIIMSTSLIQLSEQLEDAEVMELIKYLIYLVAQLFHLLVFSIEGQKLIDHSLETHAKIYNGLWYDIPVKSQKLLLFAMRKSMEIVSLSAGKIYIFSLENFTMIMKTSVSYFTVLSSFN